MILLFFFLTTLLLTLCVFAWQHLRSKSDGALAREIVFEAKIDPPFLRPVVTRLQGGDLSINAPVIHARLIGGILVLDIKSNSGAKPEGFELAITEFDFSWLNAQQYAYHSVSSQLLVGPQGEATDRLLERAARQHNLSLPAESGPYVQAFAISGVVTDPSDFKIEVQAVLPSGAPLHIVYDYANASVNALVPAQELGRHENYNPLGIKMEAA